MELDELKSTWQALNARLQKQETLNNYLIEKMLQRKYGKSLNRLLNYDWFALVLMILLLPLSPWAIFSKLIPLNFPLSWLVCYVFLTFLLLYALSSRIWKIYTLTKIDPSKPLSNNMRIISRYNVYVKKEMIFSNIIVSFPLAFILISAYRMAPAALPVIIGCLFFAIAGLVAGIWIYKRFIIRHLTSIRQNLNELKDLDEEKG